MTMPRGVNRLFRRCGFYLHAGWVYEYPFAVRRWTRDDYAGMFGLTEAELKILGVRMAGD